MEGGERLSARQHAAGMDGGQRRQAYTPFSLAAITAACVMQGTIWKSLAAGMISTPGR